MFKFAVKMAIKVGGRVLKTCLTEHYFQEVFKEVGDYAVDKMDNPYMEQEWKKIRKVL